MVGLVVACAPEVDRRDAGVASGGSPGDAGPDSAPPVDIPPASHPDGSLGPSAWGDPGCGCPPGEYWLEVSGDLADQVFAFPVPTTMPACPDGPLRVPWCVTGTAFAEIAACATSDPTVSCLVIYTRSSIEGTYIDRTGTEWELVLNELTLPADWETLARGDVAIGEYDAWAYALERDPTRLLGSFQLCVWDNVWLL
jgi:hypothetical protein